MTETATTNAEVLTASGNNAAFVGTVATLSTAKAANSDFSLLKGVVNTGATPATVFTLDGNGKVTQNGELVISDNSGSTASNEGALQVTGGAGIGQNLFVGGTLNSAGVATVSLATDSSSATDGALVVTGGAGIAKKLYVGGTMNAAGITSVTANTGSTGTGNGALVVTGGAGIGQNLFVGGTLNSAGVASVTL